MAVLEFCFNLRGSTDVHPSVRAGKEGREGGGFWETVLVPMFYSTPSQGRAEQSECSSCQSVDQDGSRVRYM